MSFSDDDYDPDYFVDPPQRSPPPPVQKIVNKKKKRTAVVAKKSKPDPVGAMSDVEDTCNGEDGVPHQWTTKQIRTLIQIRLSDEIDRKFRTTKRSHKHLWLAVAKKLQSVGIPVDEVQASSKFNRLRREYSRRYTKVNKSGADRSPLFDWEFYADLEPSFRNCRQIQPDNVECSEMTRTPVDTTSSEDQGSVADSNDAGSSSTPSSSGPLVFPNRRKKRSLTQDDRDEMVNHRTMVNHLAKLDERYSDFNATFTRMADAQIGFYNVQKRLAEAQLSVFERDNDL